MHNLSVIRWEKWRMTDLKAKTCSYLWTNPTAGICCWTDNQPIVAVFKPGMSVATYQASRKTDDHLSRCLANLGRESILSYSHRCNSQCLHSCQHKHRNLGYFLHGTYIPAYCLIVKTESVTEKEVGSHFHQRDRISFLWVRWKLLRTVVKIPQFVLRYLSHSAIALNFEYQVMETANTETTYSRSWRSLGKSSTNRLLEIQDTGKIGPAPLVLGDLCLPTFPADGLICVRRNL